MLKIRRSFHARNRSPIRAAIRPAICSQFRAESARLPGPLSRTIGATMQPAPSTPSTQPHVLALRLRGEKPHQGLRSKNPAPYRVRNRCNLRNALGLRAGCAGNRVRSFCSGEQYDQDLALYYLRARYYNPATGRFMSRDPEDGKAKDPKTLHKYLYVGGDPVNWIDPRGRTMAEYPLLMQIGATAIIVGAEVVFTLETAELWGMLDGPPGGYPPHPAPGNCPSCGEPGLPPSGPPYPPGQQPPITPDPGTWPEEW